uniref:Calmodulin n=1 Tax=Guillardia theta TaxID=55529 RepID=A0A7S4JTG1_GUITH|mmetsp:Transcript_18614/g.61146  ORF Transcript_18614/g.61146 Transcript_18614/m.61146 type:complete len:1058 (+) Transcript_18614:271-3444(+)
MSSRSNVLQHIPSIHGDGRPTHRQGRKSTSEQLDAFFSEVEKQSSLLPPISSSSCQPLAHTNDVGRSLQEHRHKGSPKLNANRAVCNESCYWCRRQNSWCGWCRVSPNRSEVVDHVRSRSSLQRSSSEKQKIKRSASQLSQVSKRLFAIKSGSTLAASAVGNGADPKDAVELSYDHSRMTEIDKLLELATFALSAILSKEQLKALTSRVQLRSFGENEIVFRSGEVCSPQVYTVRVEDGLPKLAMRPSFYIVHSGEFHAYNRRDPTRLKPFECLRRGSVFGELSFFLQDQRHCTVVAGCESVAIEVLLSEMLQILVPEEKLADARESEVKEEESSASHQDRYLALLKGNRSKKDKMYHFYRRKAEIEVFGLPLNEDSRKREWRTGAYARKLKRILNFELTIYYVVKIQFLVRRFLRRLRLKAQKAREREREKAALFLQRIARGFLARIFCNKMRMTNGLQPLNFQELFERRRREKAQMQITAHVKQESARLWNLFNFANDKILSVYRQDFRKQHLEQLKILMTAIEDGKIGKFAFYDVAKDAKIPGKALKRWINDENIVKKRRDEETNQDFELRNQRTKELLEEQLLVWAGRNESVREAIGLWKVEVLSYKEAAPEVTKKPHPLCSIIPDYYDMKSLREILSQSESWLGLNPPSARSEASLAEGGWMLDSLLNHVSEQENYELQHQEQLARALVETHATAERPSSKVELEEPAGFGSASSSAEVLEGADVRLGAPEHEAAIRPDVEMFIARIKAALYHSKVDIRKMFLALDKDKDGYLSLHEFDNAMRILNVRINSRDLYDISKTFVDDRMPTQLCLRMFLSCFTSDLICSESITDKVSLFSSTVMADFEAFAQSKEKLEQELISKGSHLLDQFYDLLFSNQWKRREDKVELLSFCALKSVISLFELDWHDRDTLVRFVRVLLYIHEQLWSQLLLELCTWYMPIESEAHLRKQLIAMKTKDERTSFHALSRRMSCFMPQQELLAHQFSEFARENTDTTCEEGKLMEVNMDQIKLRSFRLWSKLKTEKGNVVLEMFIDVCNQLTNLCHIEREVDELFR